MSQTPALSGKVVAITGGARGIGLASAAVARILTGSSPTLNIPTTKEKS